MALELIHDDCLVWLRAQPNASIHCCVTDAPYSLGFMGKTWDKHADYDAAFGYYLSGLVDGDGCFRVQSHQRGSATCAFQLKLRRDDTAILERARRELGGVGILQPQEGSGNASPLTSWVVQDKKGCLKIADYFSHFPLRAKKAHEFMVWRDAVTDWNEMVRGNRWHGRGDYGPMLSAKERIERLRKYRDPAWSGNGFQDWVREWGEEVLRVLKPGGTILCFGGTRTVHRLTCGLEDAGFEIKDTLMWLYGQGMSHSLNLSKKMIEKHETGEAKKWEGWHSHHLGPGYEPIVMAIKNNEGAYIENAIKWGVGGLNTKACRIPGGEVTINTFDNGAKPFGDAVGEPYTSRKSSGRYPKNLLHDGSDEVLAGFPNVKAGKAIRRRSGGKNCHNDTQKPPMPDMGYGDDGSAARFFNRLGWSEDELRFMYQAKASKKEKGPDNNHPCVKPVALMRWLVRLVCPPDGVVLDPFMGSGTTGVACREEEFDFIGIERELESYEIAVGRC